jgi:dTDP-4-amino-4,6-dideoxygalactose transaminase
MISAELLITTADRTVRQAFEQLNCTGQGILLLVDSTGRLQRTITDGDLRRLVIAGFALESTLAVLPAQAAVLTDDSEDLDRALHLMNQNEIDHLPVVNPSNSRPVGVLSRRMLGSRILLSTPHLSGLEAEFVESAFRTNWIAPLGPNVDAFENELAALVGIGEAAALSSGTAAIHLALRLLDVSRGDVVFCSSLTFVASANPILYEGATPVFIDSEPESWNMSPAALQRALEWAAAAGTLPKAVIVVSLYGQSADMDPLLALCNHYRVPIIEDAAESLGATYGRRHSGTMGLMGTYSFNGNKIITTSGGGMLVSSDRDLIRRARFLATQAREPASHYEHRQVGYNYRLSNVLAGIGRGQLRVLGDRVDRRRQVFHWYQTALADLTAIEWMPEAPYGRATRWLSVLVLDPSRTDIQPADLIAGLAEENIEARPIWKPMHRQPLFSQARYFPHHPQTSVSDQIFDNGVCLPSGSDLELHQVERVCRQIRKVFENRHTVGTPGRIARSDH